MARWFRWGLSVAGSFVCRCLTSPTMLRFHFPLIEPDGPISGIRLSDKESCFRPRVAARDFPRIEQSQNVFQVLVGIVAVSLTL